MSSEEPVIVETGLPGWARLLLGLFIAGIIGIVSLIIVGSISFAAWQKNATDPQVISNLVAKDLHIQSLPEGFTYSIGYSFAGMDIVNITYKKSETEFLFVKLPNAKNLTNENLYVILPNDPMQPLAIEDIKTKGTEDVGPYKLHYIIGSINAGTPLPQMRAAMLTDNGKSILRITGTTMKGAFDMDATRRLLASIK